MGGLLFNPLLPGIVQYVVVILVAIGCVVLAMACWLTSSIHNPKQYWLMLNMILRNTCWNLKRCFLDLSLLPETCQVIHFNLILPWSDCGGLISFSAWGALLLIYGFTLIPAWISTHVPSKVCYGITYQFSNFNGVTVEVWEWISNFIPHFTGHVITHPCWD